MCACRPCSSRPVRALHARERAPAWSTEKPNFESAWPWRSSRVSPTHVGRHAHQHLLIARRAAHARASAAPAARSRRSCRARSARCRARAPRAARPRTWRCRAARSAPGEARVQREVQLAAGGDVAPEPLLVRAAPAPRCRETPWRRTPRGNRSWPARAPRPGTRARARAGHPRRRRTPACRTPCASSIVSQPPTCRRPRSSRRLPSGNTSESSSASPCADYRVPPAQRRRTARRSATGRRRSAGRCAQRAVPPRRASSASHSPPTTISAMLSSCGGVRPARTPRCCA